MNILNMNDIKDNLIELTQEHGYDVLAMRIFLSIESELKTGFDNFDTDTACTLLNEVLTEIDRESKSGNTSLPLVLLRSGHYEFLLDCLVKFDFTRLLKDNDTRSRRHFFTHLSSSFVDNANSSLFKTIMNRLAHDTYFKAYFLSSPLLQNMIAMSFYPLISMKPASGHIFSDTKDSVRFGEELKCLNKKRKTAISYIQQYPCLLTHTVELFYYIHESQPAIDPALIMLTLNQLPTSFVLRHCANANVIGMYIAYHNISITEAINAVDDNVKVKLLKQLIE